MNDFVAASSVIALTGIGNIGEQNSYKPSDNQSPLGEKFQFSSVLKSTIDTVEKTYSDAQKIKEKESNLHPIETSSSDQESFSKDLDNEVAPSKNADPDEIYSSKNESNFDKSNNDNAPSERNESSDHSTEPEKSPEQSQLKSGRDNSANQVFGENQAKVASATNTDAISNINPSGQNTGNAQSKVAHGNSTNQPKVEIHSHPESLIPQAVASAKTDGNKIKVNTTNPGNNIQSTTKNTGEIASAIDPAKKISEVSEDLSKTITKNNKQGISEQKAPSTANSNLNKQAQDLSNRLKNKSASPVKISVENNVDKFDSRVPQSNANQLNAMPSHTKAPIAQLAEISLEEGQGPVSKLATTKINISGDPKASNSHNIRTKTNATTQNQTANFLNESQMLRRQAAAISAQQTASSQANMAPKAPVMADMPSINAVSGPNQTQQITKTAAPPPPPPPKPPVPAEQVAVQIRKAIGEGADKINIKLHPANLGRVEVRMDIGKDGILTAVVIAEKPETLEMLQRDVRGLEKVLQEGGLKTDSQSFNFSLKEHAQQRAAIARDRADEQLRNDNQNSIETETDDAEDLTSAAPIYGRNLATNGRVDITI